MKRREFTAALAGLASPGAFDAARAAAGVTEGDAALGVRTALERAAATAVSLLGRSGGFLDNPAVRIPLPGFLENAARLLKVTGQQRQVDELVTGMNRAAEAAVPEARLLLVAAIRSMSVDDARTIVTGGDDAATRFFESKTRVPLMPKFMPIVTRATQRLGLAQRYDAVAGRAAAVGLVGKEDSSVDRYVTERALDGLYRTIGEQERQIRRDPVATGSALLRQVFAR